METARRASVSVEYNGTEVTQEIAETIGNFQYTDVASGSSDSISISIDDNADKWLNDWYPVRGDSITASIDVATWRTQGDARTLMCGTFTN